MSKPNEISYGVMPEDEASDMDVSSDDDGINVYPASTPLQPTHTDDNQSNHSNAFRGPHYEESYTPRLTANPTTSSGFVGQQSLLSMAYCESDRESVNSFHTAPSSPIDLTLDDEPYNTNADQQPDLMDELQKEYEELTKELETIDIEEKRILSLLEEKKATLEALKVRELELQVRKSIQKNRKAVVKLPKDKGKQKAPIDLHYNSFSSNSEDDEDQPPKKTMAIVNTETGQPEKRAVEEPHKETRRRSRRVKGKAKESVFQDVVENESIQATARRNKKHQHIVRQSQLKGYTSIGQMKMFLCDLYDKFEENEELTEPQRAHYKVLVKKIAKYDENGDDYVPAIGSSYTRRRKGGKVEPKAQFMLPEDYYGHPERLDFGNLYVDRIKLLDALNCSRVDTPKNVRRATAILSSKASRLTVADFQDIIDSRGEIMNKNKLKVIDSGLNDYAEPSRQSRTKTRAKMLPLPKVNLNESETKGKKAYYLNQRELAAGLKDTESPSLEPAERSAELSSSSPLSSDSAPFIAGSGSPSTFFLNNHDAENVTEQLLANSKSITTISSVPGKTSFGRHDAPASQQPFLPKSKRKLFSPESPHPLQSASPIPPEPAILKLYDDSPSTTSNGSATMVTENHQANTQNQNVASSFFQPYRSALDSLGVSLNSDVSIKKTGILCKAESNGGVCNDKSCPDMHFADFA
ncbi:hypothetical protein [Parasitella parasitica]|uniref:Putative zinc-finger domain-containing protein n=1 Tax=Parasitella parasitica TaxID=35722 RepID=A0A0B7ND46_9FUNG|nr:hypothetical protein [Parasitella parasitica]